MEQLQNIRVIFITVECRYLELWKDRKKVRDSAIFETVRLQDSEITPVDNSRYRDFDDSLTSGRIGPKKKQEYHEKAYKRSNYVWVNERINIKNIREDSEDLFFFYKITRNFYLLALFYFISR